MRAIFSAFCAATALICAGCEVGPDYKPPATTMPGAWSQTAPTTSPYIPAAPQTQSSVVVPGAANLKNWWKSFGDPELNSLVERGIAANLDIRQAAARLRQARAQRGVVASALAPTANVTGAYTRSHPPPGANTGSSSDANLFQAGFDAAWELDFFGGARRGVEAADYNIDAAVADQQDVTLTLISEVAMDYLQLRGYQRQIDIATHNIEVERKSADLTHLRVAGGVQGALDAANADAQVATTISQIPPLESQVQQTIHALCLLLALQPAALEKELAATQPIPVVPPEVPIGLPSELLRRRPDIRRAERQLAAATANIGQATADLFPQFSLTGALGLENSQLKNLPSWNPSGFWSIGPSVTWPILDGGRIRANIEVQNALQEQALAVYQAAVLTSLQDVENALVAYNKEQQHRRALIDAVAANRKAVQIASDLYVAGMTNFLNVLIAQTALLASEDALAQSEVTVATDLVALYKALGGGWDVQPAEQK